jgi:hypothetical protein
MENWKLSIHWDKRVSWGYNMIWNATKIIKLDSTLVWTCGDYIHIDYLEEMYKEYKEGWFDLETRTGIINFYKWITETTKKKDISLMFLSEKFQIIVAQDIMEWMEIENKNGLFAMWSWFQVPLALYRHNKEISIKEMYDTIVTMDNKTSKEFSSLRLK